jgi:hypothetical protein
MYFHMYTQFNANLGAKAKQATTIAIQYRIDNLNERYHDGLMNVIEYLDGLSLTSSLR